MSDLESGLDPLSTLSVDELREKLDNLTRNGGADEGPRFERAQNIRAEIDSRQPPSGPVRHIQV